LDLDIWITHVRIGQAHVRIRQLSITRIEKANIHTELLHWTGAFAELAFEKTDHDANHRAHREG
jgi:hypothetical protein